MGQNNYFGNNVFIYTLNSSKGTGCYPCEHKAVFGK